MDLSNMVTPGVWPVVNGHVLKKHILMYSRVTIASNKTRYIPFPEGAKGFLYQQQFEDAGLGRVIRFRIVPDGDPAKFSEGTDLKRRDGNPWYSTSHDITSMLPLPDAYDGSRASHKDEVKRALRPLTRLADPVVLEFNKVKLLFRALDPNGRYLGDIVTDNPLRFRRTLGPVQQDLAFKGMYKTDNCQTGSAICRFEQSQLPEHRATEKSALVLRVLKITDPFVRKPTPPGYASPDIPEEGKLLPSSEPGKKFSYGLERMQKRKGMRALYLLWQRSKVPS